LGQEIGYLFRRNDFDKVTQRLDGFDLYVHLGVFEQVAVGLDETHIGDFLPKIGGYLCKVFGKAQSDSPRLVFSSLDDEGHDESLILISGENFGDFLEAFSGQYSYLVLLICRSMFEDANQVAEDIFLLVNSAHMRNLCCGHSLQHEHLFV
jgi:hypothetical protein